MSSDRPRTPPRSTFSIQAESAESERITDSKTNATDSFYIPHVSDLVNPARDAINLLEKSIPPVYLEAEAVDTSILLGHGASFTASLRKLPEGPKTIEVTTHMDGWDITSSKPAPPRPAYVVYKTARIAFDKTGEPLPQFRRAMQSVLTEFHALVHPQLSKHANVIRFLGIAWGSNPFSSFHRLPALIVEYAEHGTLSRVLSLEKGLDYDLKHLLCLDVARGLSALHQAGLVHGDVKAENVLVCSSPSRKYLAKISDFGFSVMTATESDTVWMGGTDPWRAPETKLGPVNVDSGSKTDVYSFGLLAWVICLNGQNPFNFLGDSVLKDDEIEAIKRSDDLLTMARDKPWLSRYLGAGHDPKIDQLYEQALNTVSKEQEITDTTRTHLMLVLPMIRSRLVTELVAKLQQKALVKSLDSILGHCLQSNPESRDLDSVLVLLESGLDAATSTIAQQKENIEPNEGRGTHAENSASSPLKESYPHNISEGAQKISDRSFWLSRGYRKRWFSWQKTRDLEPSVQNFIFNSFLVFDNTDKSPELFMLCSYFMNGYGCKPDIDQALRMLQQAANRGNLPARAFMYRIWQACRPNEKNPGAQYLEDYAKAGSKSALADIVDCYPNDKMATIKKFVRDATGGVGAHWLEASQMLGGYTQSQWIEDGWLIDKAQNADIPLSELIVNKRGDTLLHFTAMCGRWSPLKSLVLDHKMDINLRNALGETPLLCACRAGQGATTIYCLQVFHADASLAANNGETPLHWVVQFGDENTEAIVKDMISRGAKINAATKERLSHSYYPANIDMEFHMPGSALAWAVDDNRPHIVRTLLKYGADPNYVPEGAALSPLASAAYYHRHECLRAMINFLEPTVTQTTTNGRIDKRFTVMYGALVIQAEEAADKFSMILRNGASYLKDLHATLDLLRHNTVYAKFEGQMQGSMLFIAVSKAHDEVIEYMFQNRWLIGTINTAISDSRRTPVLEAVRWNRETLVQTLLDNGADTHAQAANPFAPEKSNWSALHIFAHEGHDRDLSLVDLLVKIGLPVDGAQDNAPEITDEPPDSLELPNISALSVADKTKSYRSNETPFAVAVRHNAFNLARKLLSLGADPNSLSTEGGLFASAYPLTVLGHVIISNARYSQARLNFLLSLDGQRTDFVVEPSRKLTALHRCAMAYQDVAKRAGGAVTREEFDMDTNADIMYELLMKWNQPHELDARCAIDGNTALHLAVGVQNLGAVKGLIDAGASTSIENENGKTAYQLATEIGEPTTSSKEIVALLTPPTTQA